MITHIVCWKLISDETHDADANAARIKEELEALVGIVPGLLTMEVGRGLKAEAEYDLCLVSTFESVETLQAYRTHPAHVAVAEFVHTALCKRTAIDFENDGLIDGAVDPFVF